MDEIENLREQNRIWGRDAGEAHRMLDRAGIPQMERHADRVAELIARHGRALTELTELRAYGQVVMMPTTSRPAGRDADHELAQLHGFTRHLPEPAPAAEPLYWVDAPGEYGDTVANPVYDQIAHIAAIVTDAGRLAWLRDMHTLHIRAEFVYTVGGYCLAITNDGDELETYEATEDADSPDLDACWRQVIDKAAAEWRNGKRIGAGK